MEENKDLTPEDKVRIEQEAAKLFNRWDGGLVNVQTMLLSIAEYATLYERQQQAALKELNRTLYESNERQAVVISEFKQEGSSERARANNAVGKYWEKLQQIEKLEAERSELIKENERMLKSIEAMLIALNQCGPEIGWNTSSYIEAAYAEHKAIFKAALNESQRKIRNRQLWKHI